MVGNEIASTVQGRGVEVMVVGRCVLGCSTVERYVIAVVLLHGPFPVSYRTKTAVSRCQFKHCASAPGATRTRDRQIRSLLLYPTELRRPDASEADIEATISA